MTRGRKIIVLAGILILFSTFLWAQNKGAKDITIQGGVTGNVPFKHHLHQNSLKDCNVCHNLFPQTPGIILKLKSEGKLESKKVMNQCQKCHREKINAGVKSGPVTCKSCHIK